MTNNKKRVCLNISKEVKHKLDEVKHTGQSYDGFIQELLIHWENGRAPKEVIRGPSSPYQRIARID